MKTTAVLRAAVMMAVAAFPLIASAQFQQPTEQELKMTSDPKAPGADAVYLDFQEKDDNMLHFRTVYARIKVLTEKGKERATVTIPYEAGGFAHVDDIKARTIHPDGTVIPLEGKPADLLVVKSGDYQQKSKTFTLPSVTVGSILEYRYELRYSDYYVMSPTWAIQGQYFVHKAHYVFIPWHGLGGYFITNDQGKVLNHLVDWVNLPKGVQLLVQDASSKVILDVSDIPAAPNEEYAPPADIALYNVKFYYSWTKSSDKFWQDAADYWSKQTDHFADPSKAVREAVKGIVAPGDSEIDKAKKLYAAVEALDNTDYSRQKSQSEMKKLKMKNVTRAEDVWKNKSGDSNDIALLYLSMLRAAGLKAWAITVKNRDDGPFDQSYMSSDQFDATLVILESGGKEILLDPGEKMCPFGTVNWRHSGVGGIRQFADKPGFTITPQQSFMENQTTREGDINIDGQGNVTGRVNFVMTGQAALKWRQMALRNDDAAVKKNFDSVLATIVPVGVEAHVDHFLGMNQPDSNLMAVVNVKGRMGSAMGKRLLLPGLFFESRGNEPFVKEAKRLEPVDMHYSDEITDQVTYHLPADMTVEGAPANDKIAWPGHAVDVVKSEADPGEITMACALVRGFTEVKAAEYSDLRGFYQKVAAEDQQEMVLKRVAAARGN